MNENGFLLTSDSCFAFLLQFTLFPFRLESKAEKLHKEANGYAKSLRGE
jgi:hypothetical protein